jgi:hypothetical protein
MPLKLTNTVRGSSAQTGKAVIRLGGKRTDPSLILPQETDLTTPDGLRKLNEVLEQVEIRLRKLEEFEVKLATKFGYGSLAALTTTAQPIPGAKVVLDKIGTWLLIGTWDWDAAAAAEAHGFVVLDPQTTTTAKRQTAWAKMTAAGAEKLTTTAWCLFTVTQVPRLAQLYGKKVSGGVVDLLEAGTSLVAVWVGSWGSGEKRFGRQIESQYTGAEDLNQNTLTDHGEEARWPASDNPDKIANGVDQASL